MTTSPGNSVSAEDLLAHRMLALGVREADLEEVFTRSGGHGGQNVNKTSTCVVLRHRPTGVQIKCQATRQQGKNRLLARRLLLNKLEAMQRRQVLAVQSVKEKARRKTRPRPWGMKIRILEGKSRQQLKKRLRRRPMDES